MSDTIFSVFEQLADAEGARGALFAAGFPASAVHLRTRGAAIGAHTDAASSTVERIIGSLGKSGARYARDASRALYLLSVDGRDPAQLERAAEILRGCGAVSVTPPAGDAQADGLRR